MIGKKRLLLYVCNFYYHHYSKFNRHCFPIHECFLFRCEPFSTYPRSYDLLHASYLFSHYKDRGNICQLEDILLETDRMLRPEVAFNLFISNLLLRFKLGPTMTFTKTFQTPSEN